MFEMAPVSKFEMLFTSFAYICPSPSYAGTNRNMTHFRKEEKLMAEDFTTPLEIYKAKKNRIVTEKVLSGSVVRSELFGKELYFDIARDSENVYLVTRTPVFDDYMMGPMDDFPLGPRSSISFFEALPAFPCIPYPKSKMAKKLVWVFWNLPDEIRRLAEPVVFHQTYKGQDYQLESPVFLLSATQLFGYNPNKDSDGDDEQLDIFYLEPERIKKGHAYWLRSHGISGTFQFAAADGSLYEGLHSHLNGIMFAICIGKRW